MLACSCRSASSGGAGATGTAFQPASPRTYVAKVKNILVGLAPTDTELQAVERDPAALGGLVDGWMTLPQYSQKMMHFFELAFQQTQIGANDFTDEVFAPIGLNPATTPMILQNVQESFARTMVELTAGGHPLTEAMTTQTVMMTTALKELYALLDTVDIDDTGFVYDHYRAAHRNVGIVAEASQGPIPIAETLDPTSANYMHWYDPDVTVPVTPPECQQDPVTLRSQAITLHYLLLGALDLRVLSNNEICAPLRRHLQGLPAHRERLRRLDDGHDTTSRTWRGDDRVLRLAGAPCRGRARAVHAARGLLQHAGFSRELADQREQPDARHGAPGAHRRDRLVD